MFLAQVRIGADSRATPHEPSNACAFTPNMCLCCAGQLERWQQQPQPASEATTTPPRKRTRQQTGSSTPSSAQQADANQQQPEATLILDSEEHEPAAMAVLASLYGVSTTADQLTDLQHLHMITIADMLQERQLPATWPALQ